MLDVRNQMYWQGLLCFSSKLNTCCETQATWGQSIITLYSLFTTNMLICQLPWVPMGRGSPCATFATDALWKGGCPCALVLLHYISSTLAPNCLLNRFQIVLQQTGIIRVCTSQSSFPTLYGEGGVGVLYTYTYFTSGSLSLGYFPALGLGGRCSPDGVCLFGPFLGVPPDPLRMHLYMDGWTNIHQFLVYSIHLLVSPPF